MNEILTIADAADYIAAKGCTWCSPEQALSSAATRFRIRAHKYAGSNTMQHHRPSVPRVGMDGGIDVFSNLFCVSPETAKFKAGEWIRHARECRNLGYQRGMTVLPSLEKAAFWRRKAMEATQ